MPGERLDAEWVRFWWEQSDAALTKLMRSFLPTHGFPFSQASLPDVDNGYFIHSPATAAEHFREYGPAPIDGESIALVFASDGGGHLFAIGDSGHVWKSTTASWFDDFEVAASSLQEFLEQLGRRIANQT
ncbi:hypothetical protein [Streptomyces tanashiensis]|uniref:SMI1/KNR4 family protein n=1 Tax=Streptomyces tanashiensis TaxID=67367 RepID=A0ABY6R8D3_9ACTN|nr:hypothetical protein [Streptomyces tanashiensis]UZX26333.1 hypothetical protein LDH80_39415 [Streptomyces tanashiensis]